jgi:hypothetical protein
MINIFSVNYSKKCKKLCDKKKKFKINILTTVQIKMSMNVWQIVIRGPKDYLFKRNFYLFLSLCPR